MFHLTHNSRKASVTGSARWHDFLTAEIPVKRVVRKSHTTAYHRATLAASIHAACMKSFGYSGEAETSAIEVCKAVESWLQNKEEVTVADIKRRAAETLRHYNPRAAYEYLPSKQFQLNEDEYGFIRL